MSYSSKKPGDAHALLGSDAGWVYLDVRTEEEFAMGHPTGAWNIPFALRGAMGMQPNPEFATVVQRHFEKDKRLVVGCASGMRSASACALLASAGFTNLVNLEGGFMGGRDAAGTPIAGWSSLGLPSETSSPPDRTFATLRRER